MDILRGDTSLADAFINKVKKTRQIAWGRMGQTHTTIDYTYNLLVEMDWSLASWNGNIQPSRKSLSFIDYYGSKRQDHRNDGVKLWSWLSQGQVLL